MTYTYAMRFMMKLGPAKTHFFDHLQGELESSLEKLNHLNEKDWRDYIEQDMK